MKTNQVMSVSFSHGILEIGHKTMTGCLADVFTIGNKHRVLEGKSAMNASQFLQNNSTKDFVDAVARRLKVPAESILYTIGRGKSARIMANLHIMIYAAEYLSPDFHAEVIDTFINNKILTWRDESGDAFKGLNEQIKDCAEQVLGKPAHTGHFVTISKIINARIGNGVNVDWNTATAEQLSERKRIEDHVMTALRMGFIKDWEHLKQVVTEI